MSAALQFATLIQEKSAFAGPICLTVAFLGCLLGTNLLVPAGAILTAVGVLIGAGVVSWTIVLWAICGASIGMSISYSVGLRLGLRLQQIPLFRTRSGFIARARLLFERYRFASILIAYFSGPLRAPVAAVAAIAGMPRGQFELANIVSAIVWAFTAVGIGAIPGSMIESNSVWLLIGPLLMPVITIGISLMILFLRSVSGR